MNKIYKVVWSKARNCYVVASEFAKGHTKSTNRNKKNINARNIAAVIAVVLGMSVMPLGGTVFAEKVGAPKVISDEEYSPIKEKKGNLKGLSSADNNILFADNGDMGLQLKLAENIAVKSITTETIKKSDGTELDLSNIIQGVRFDNKGNLYYTDSNKTEHQYGTVHDYTIASGSYDADSKQLTLTKTDAYGNQANSTVDIDLSDISNGLAKTDLSNITTEGEIKITNLAKAADVHVSEGTYDVKPDGSVTMTYADGNNQAITGKELKITGIASKQAVDALDDRAVKYDTKKDGTVNRNSVTLGGTSYKNENDSKTGGTTITNVAYSQGIGSDAVNVDYLNDHAVKTNLSNITNEGKTTITNLAKAADIHVKDGNYTVDENGNVTMKYEDGNGNLIEGKSLTITGLTSTNANNAAVVYVDNDKTKSLHSTNSGNIGTGSIALGKKANAVDDSIAIGDGASVVEGSNGQGGVALGKQAHAGYKGISLGNSAISGREGVIAIGDSVNSQGLYSTVAGTGSKITTDGTLYTVELPLLGEKSVDVQGAIATSYGAYNAIENNNKKVFSGVANSVIGSVNTVTNSNGITIQGTGNKVTNAYKDMNITPSDLLKFKTGDYSTLAQKDSGAVAVIGGANTISDQTSSTVIGFGNTVAGTNSAGSTGVFTAGSHNKLTHVSNSLIMGDNNTLENRTNVISLGNKNTVKANNVVAIGNGTVVSVDGSVAIGTNSVADRVVKEGVAGAFAPDTIKDTEKSIWTATAGTVSVGDANKDLTRQITNVAAGSEDTDAVNVAQLKKVQETITGDVSNKTFGLTDDSGKAKVTNTLNNTVQVKGANGITSTVKDGALEIGLGNNITVGKDGKDGTAGAAGSIGLVGKDGKDGLTTTTIKTEYGPAGVDGKDGITRIVYETQDKVKHEVATLDDGLKFKGDTGDTISKKLNETLNIKGNAVGTAELSDGNIGVVGENGGLTVKLNKDLKDLNSVTTNNAYVTNVGESDNSVTNVKYVKDQIADVTLKAGDGISIADKKINVKLKDGKQNLVVDNNGLSLKNDISLGDTGSDTSVVISGSKGTIQASASIAAGNIIMDSHDGDITGLTNKTLDGKDFAQKGRAATEEQLKLVKDSITGDVGKKTFGLADDNNKTVTTTLDNTVQVKGANGITSTVKDGALEIGLGNDITVGKDGAEGHIGLNGKDGMTDIWTTAGKPGLNGKDGETMTRVVYEDPQGNTHEVATLDDGLKFQGDRGGVIAKKLNETLAIKGNADEKAELSDGNIGVVGEFGELTVKLNKDLTGLNSATFGNTTINNNGLTVGTGTTGLEFSTNRVSVGGQQIHDVADGKDDMDAVNVSQLKGVESVANKGWNLSTNGKEATQVKPGDTVDFFGDDNISVSNKGTNVKVALNKDINVNSVQTNALNVKYNLSVGTAAANGKMPFFVNSNGSFYAASGEFSVEKDGSIKATSGDIGDVTLNNGVFYKNSALRDGELYVGDADGNYSQITSKNAKLGKITIDDTGRISGVATGRIAADSTDAVNGSQLHAVQQEAGKHTKVVNGSNITVEETDQDGQKTYKVGLNKDILLGDATGKNVNISGTNGTIETTGYIATKDRVYADKGAKLADVDITKDTLSNGPSKVVLNEGYAGMAYGDTSIALMQDNVVLNSKVTVGKDGKISGIAAGRIAADSTDAVNGSQLHAVQQEASKHTKVVNGSNITVEETDQDGQKTYKVGLNKDILLGDVTGKNVNISGTNGTIETTGYIATKDRVYADKGAKLADVDITKDTLSNGPSKVVLNEGYAGMAYGDTNVVLMDNGVYLNGKVNVDKAGQIHNVTAGTADEDAVNVSQLNKATASSKTTVSDGTNTTVTSTVAEDGHVDYKVNLNKDLTGVESISNGTNGQSKVVLNEGYAGMAYGDTNVVLMDNGVYLNGKVNVDKAGQIHNVTAGIADEDAVNVSQLKGVESVANKGWNLSTNGSKEIMQVKPGETVDFSGDDNISVTNDGTNVKTTLNKNLQGIESITNGDARINLNETGIVISKGNDKTFSITDTGMGMSVIGDDYVTRSIMVGKNGTVITGGLSVAGSKITNVAAGTDDTDAVNVGQLKQAVSEGNTDTHIKAGEYSVGQDNTVSMDVVDKNGRSTGEKVTIKDVAKASDVGDVSKIANDIKNKEGNTTVVDAVNNVNNKVGDLKYSTVTSGDINDGDNTTTAIGKLNQKLSDVEQTAGKHSSVSTEDSNLSISEGTNTAGGTDYKLSLNKKLKLDSITTGDTKMDTSGVTVGDKVSLTKDGLTAGDTKVTNDGLSIGDKTYVSKDGLNANNQTITNVADGKVEKGSTDAVNGGQLYETNQAVINNSNNISSLSHSLSNLDNRVNKVGAGAAALAALHPLDFDPDAKWDFAAGYGNYRGTNAAAVGAYYRPNEDTMFSVGGTFGNGENMVNAGVSFKLGAGSSHVSTSRVAMAKEIKELRSELEAMKSAMLDANAGKKVDTSKLQLFPDVPQNHWAYEYITQLAGNGMIEGYPDGNFAGDRPMTRYEFAAMLYRAMTKGAVLSDKILSEFSHELEYFTVDTVSKDKAGNPTIQRVRTVKANKNK